MHTSNHSVFNFLVVFFLLCLFPALDEQLYYYYYYYFYALDGKKHCIKTIVDI